MTISAIKSVDLNNIESSLLRADKEGYERGLKDGFSKGLKTAEDAIKIGNDMRNALNKQERL